MNARHEEIVSSVTDILKRRLNPSKIILFGSRAKGISSRHADFDFALDCPKPSLSVERKIKEEIDQASGLYKVDIVYLDSVDEEFKKIIFKTGKVIYESKRN